MILVFRNTKQYYARKLGYGIGLNETFRNRVEDWNNTFKINYWDFRKSIRRLSLLECTSSNRFTEYIPCINKHKPSHMREMWVKRSGEICYPRDDDDITNITDHQLEIITKKLNYADIIKGLHCDIRYYASHDQVIYGVWDEKRLNKDMPTSSSLFKIRAKHIYPEMILPLHQCGANDFYNNEGVRTEVLNSYISLGFHGPASHTSLVQLNSRDHLVRSIEAWKDVAADQVEQINGRFLQPFLARLEAINMLKLK